MFKAIIFLIFLFTFFKEVGIVGLVLIALLLGAGSCSFEDEIDQASDECETKVREVFEEFEEKLGYLCLTEEELLEYLNDRKEEGDTTEPVAIHVQPSYSHALYIEHGIYDSNLKMCLPSRDFYRMERFPL